MRNLLVVLLFAAMCLHAQDRNFAGFVGGVSTLKGDGAFSLEGGISAQSQYKPENGPTVMVFAGRHLHDYFSVQASYNWNRNSALMSASELGATDSAAYVQNRANTQHTVIGEGMLYFRNLQSRVRPYLTAGAGFHHFRSRSNGDATVIGNPLLPPEEFSETGAAFRVAVGVDLLLHRNVAFRYSFSETIQGNSLSKRLVPEGTRKLANFQNLFGFSFQF